MMLEEGASKGEIEGERTQKASRNEKTKNIYRLMQCCGQGSSRHLRASREQHGCGVQEEIRLADGESTFPSVCNFDWN